MPQNFDEWLARQGAEQTADHLPDGLWRAEDGTLYTHCRSCGTKFQWEWSVEEFDLDTNYCGGSPRCMP